MKLFLKVFQTKNTITKKEITNYQIEIENENQQKSWTFNAYKAMVVVVP